MSGSNPEGWPPGPSNGAEPPRGYPGYGYVDGPSERSMLTAVEIVNPADLVMISPPHAPHQPGPPGMGGSSGLPHPPRKDPPVNAAAVPVNASYYGPGQSAGHSIASLAGLSQPPPPPPPPPPSHHSNNPQAPQPPPQQPMSQAPGYPLSNLGPNMPPSAQGRSGLDRDRDRERERDRDREREMRQREMRDRERERDRERDVRERPRLQDERDRERDREMHERENRERALREPHPAPHQNHAGSLPIHQPVASKVSTAIHGPGGLLSGIGAGPGAAPNPPPPPPAPPGMATSDAGSGVYTGPLPPASHQVLPFGGPNPGHPGHAVHPFSSAGVAGLPQGQQPILNDALSYLDQVKVQFMDQPDVYNRFLDIMKDFKSQAIDTPGVIERVSSLFTGHPNLIQGFNTFLPPGYRIECGAGDDPNAIRVTTPMGTTVSSMAGGGGLGASALPPNVAMMVNGASAAAAAALNARHGPYYDRMPREASGTWHSPSSHVPGGGVVGSGGEGVFSPGPRPGALPSSAHAHMGPSDGPPIRDLPTSAANASTLSQHQQEQRGVSQLQHAISVTTTGPPTQPTITHGSPNGGPNMTLPAASGPANGVATGALPTGSAGLEKRGPVEFNHAISYVNKIKNRYANQPDIYKQFLEILQTYQRESRPIQDVYAQVTQLFSGAPDLLEDFKQFLPESAAQAKAQMAAKQAAEDAATLSDLRNEPSPFFSNQAPLGPQSTPGTHRPEMKMPPVGNFAPPPSATKDTKKRRAGTGAAGSGAAATAAAALGSAAMGAGPSAASTSANKRAKTTHAKVPQADTTVISPTLTPNHPEPMPRLLHPGGANTEELAFFDRVKKYIANRQNYNEFLKLCNMFAQDLLDEQVLLNKVAAYIGGNPDLYNWYKQFVRHRDLHDDYHLNRRPLGGRVQLSNCRAYGPSYRLLPKREQLKPCSGRDEVCRSVLNDEWASHPTWASEDSGFVAHRKNVFEEAMHRVEEERHDYDYNIEANTRVIQLLEPIVKNLARMSDEEMAHYRLTPGLGGQSTTIYYRVVKKIYGREVGQKILDNLYDKPYSVVPVILARLREKTEEWKQVQREWDKIWREQASRNYWKSLDHQTTNGKAMDKKQFQQKTMVAEMQMLRDDQDRSRRTAHSVGSHYQMQFAFPDLDVVMDASRLLLSYVNTSNTYSGADRQRLVTFIREFIPTFFGINADRFEEVVRTRGYHSPQDEEMPDADASTVESSTSRGRTARQGGGLLRGVLNRGRNGRIIAPERDCVARSGSQETTPDVASVMDEDHEGASATDHIKAESGDVGNGNWLNHLPLAVESNSKPHIPIDIAINEPYERDRYSLYGGANIYCFVRLLSILYDRLERVKAHETHVAEEVRRTKLAKPAADLDMLSRQPDDYFDDTSPSAKYYPQLIHMCQEVLEQRLEMSTLEEVLRIYYLQAGWPLYNVERLISGLARFGLGAVASDARDKSADILQLFYKDRENDHTTYDAEIAYRRQVERLLKDGDLFRVHYHEPTHGVSIHLLRKDDSTFGEEGMDARTRWLYYIVSYVKIEPTEGVPMPRHSLLPFIRRHLPAEVAESGHRRRDLVPELARANMQTIICLSSYHILFQPFTADVFVHSAVHCALGPDGNVIDQKRARTKRQDRFRNWMARGNPLVKAKGEAGMAWYDEQFRAWLDDGVLPSERPSSPKNPSPQVSSMIDHENQMNHDDGYRAVENGVHQASVQDEMVDEQGDHPMEDA
ncbi:MAG: hypothetical protein M1823_005218 [Watsoniomyces obsoletus]|nr:MAG: hypothetical protein M1823_005218 [Watsoniomyces obsoletus]